VKNCSDAVKATTQNDGHVNQTNLQQKVKAKPIKTIVPCTKCGKMYSAKSLSVHEAHCEPSTVREPVVIDPEWESHLGTLKACKKCKRKFFPERHEIHEPNCKADPLSE